MSKGSAWRPTDWKKYSEAEYWENLKKRKEKEKEKIKDNEQNS